MKEIIDNFLSKCSQRFKLDLGYLIKGGFWLTIGQIANSALLFLVAVIFANRLDQVTYGNYAYLLSIFGFLALFSLPEMNAAITQSVARGFDYSFYTGFKTRFLWSLIGSITAVGISMYYALQSQILLSTPLVIGAIFLPFIHASQVYSGFLAGKKRFAQQSLFTIIVQVVMSISIIVAVYVSPRLIPLISVYVIFHAATHTALYLWTKIKYQPNKKRDAHVLQYGKHLSVLNAVATVASYIDRFLLFHFLGPVGLAVYSFAINPVRQILTVFGNLSHLLLPKFSEKSIIAINETFVVRILLLLLAGFVLTIFYFTLSPFMYRIFFPKYLDSIFHSQLFGITLVLSGVSPFLASIFRAQRLTKALYVLGISSQFLLILLIVVLGKFFGITGVVLAKTAVPFYSFFLTLLLWNRIIRKRN